MSASKTTAVNFSSILSKAKSGDYKLPAFQRKWKWTNKQVIALYDSLRLNYPIGSFLMLTSDDGDKLGPRSFHGSGKKASTQSYHESLVLDGQQRITAGLSIVYGLDDVDGSEYYINVKTVIELLKEKKVNISDKDQVQRFCMNLDSDDGYLVPKKKRQDRKGHFDKSKLLWTAYLTEDYQSDLDDIVDQIADEYEKAVVRKVVRQYLKPNVNVQVPVIELGKDFDLPAIARVFTTINTTGKQLTPFELVVAILYPAEIHLEEDVAELKSRFGYYNNMDKNGEILLQVVAMLSGLSPKKSDLPKNIQKESYEKYGEKAAEILDKAGEFLTKSMGVGLDVTDKLIPYDAIFAPLSLALDFVEASFSDHVEVSSAKNKIRTWFVVSSLMQRYQEGVHNKQTKDLEDVKAWIVHGDSHKPQWIASAYISTNIKHASPKGAIGKLILCLLNAQNPNDPMQDEKIGFGEKLHQTHVHHIIPTKWAPKSLKNYTKNSVQTDLALNTMLLHAKTNGDWLNFSPAAQYTQSLKALETESKVKAVYSTQFLNDKCVGLLSKDSFSVEDYNQFIDERYSILTSKISEYGVQEATASYSEDADLEMESPSIISD